MGKLEAEAVPPAALQWHMQVAVQGHQRAQYYFGCCLAGASLPKAVALWRQAAAQGHARAQFNVGLAYEHGDGELTASPTAAAKYCT
jgi:hypothetical protein